MIKKGANKVEQARIKNMLSEGETVSKIAKVLHIDSKVVNSFAKDKAKTEKKNG